MAIKTSVTFGNIVPANNSLITSSKDNVHFNFSVNSVFDGDYPNISTVPDYEICKLNLTLSNSSVIEDIWLRNDSATTYYNVTYDVPLDSNNTNHTWKIYCNNTTDWIGGEFVYNFRLNTITPDVISPANGSVFNNNQTLLNFSTNDAVEQDSCFYKLGLTNGTEFSYQGYNRTSDMGLANISNTTDGSLYWGNNSVFNSQIDSGFGIDAPKWHNITYLCNNTGSYNDITITNETFNATDTIYPGSNPIISTTSIENTTDSIPSSNITTTSTTINFTVDSPNIGHHLIYNVTYVIRKPTGYTYTDFTQFRVDTEDPTIGNQTYNILNTSAGANSSYPNTAGDNFINSTVEITDENYLGGTTWIKIYHPNESKITTVTATFDRIVNSSASNYSVIYNASVFSSELIENGRYYFEWNTRDAAGRNATIGSNVTYLVNNLKVGWNFVTFNENITLAEIAAKAPNITYVAIYDNRPDYKNFTQHQTGIGTNGGVRINSTLNVTLVKVSKPTLLIRTYSNIFETTNITLYSGSAGSWNLVGIVSNSSLNDTMYSDSYTNITNTVSNESFNFTLFASQAVAFPNIVTITSITNETDTIASGNYIYDSTNITLTDPHLGIENTTGFVYNVTYTWTPNYALASGVNTTSAAIYNTTLGFHCIDKRGWPDTSCPGVSTDDIIATWGMGIWIKTNVNQTLDRDSIFT